jgi:hypothetical protein
MAQAWSQFCSGTYQHRSPTLDAELCQNLFPITIESQSNSKSKALLGSPGLKALFSVPTDSCRGLFYEDGKAVAVIGGTAYDLDLVANTATSLGSIADDGLPVSFASNGRGGEQLAICGGGELKVLDLVTNVLGSAVTLPLTNAPVCVDFIDGFGLLLEADTVKVYFSALEDFESWDGLDFFARNQTSDNFVAMKVLRDRIWLLGSHTTEIFYDSGQADVPFLPYPGAILFEGCIAPWSVCTDGNSLFWLAENAEGRARFVRAADAQAQPISTDAIDFALASYTRLDNTEVLSYFQEGHNFLCWTCPSGGNCGITWVYDVKEQLWHQRGYWQEVDACFDRWRPRGVCSTPQGVIVGDHETGDVYELDLDTWTDNGAMIRRVRRAPYLANDRTWMFLDEFELGVEMGVGLNTGQGVDPQVLLRLSRDAGRTWTPSIVGRLGRMGEYRNRCIFRRLGRVRSDQLVIEISITDPIRIAIGPGAWIRASQGVAA